MVKQQLWIANSVLILFFITAFCVQILLKKDIPVFRQRKSRNIEQNTTKLPIVVNLEKIYKNDLFGTYVAQETQPIQKNFVTPIPQLNVAAPAAPPPLQKPQFLPPLPVSVKGIILANDPENSIAMVADQTGKEHVYRIGEKIQDAQVLKLTKNKMVVLRANGQQETFYLRKPEKLTSGLSKWEYAIKKIDENLYHIDPLEFTKEITSAGELVELLNIGAHYENSTPTGVRIGNLSHHPVGGHLGLQEDDIITSINQIPTITAKDRIRILDTISKLEKGEQIIVIFKRGTKQKTYTYLLAKIEKPSPFELSTQRQLEQPETNSQNEELFKLGKDAQKRERTRRFQERHRTKEQQAMIVKDLRQRLLENMQQRSRNRRVW